MRVELTMKLLKAIGTGLLYVLASFLIVSYVIEELVLPKEQ